MADRSSGITVRGHPLDRQQLAAVIDDADTQLVIAAAGTGKTTTLVGKVRHLVDSGVDPRGILLISLTNNTVSDLRRAVDDEFDGSFPGDVMTIHALGNRILRRRPCVGKDRTALLGRIMYDAAEEDRRFARALLLYVEGLRTVGYSDLSLCGISIRNRGLRNFADALFECGIRCTYERPVFSEKGSKPASVHAEDGRGHAITVHSDDDAAKEAAKDPREAWEYLERHGFACERINPNDLAAEVLSAWGDRLPEAVGALISRCKSTGTTIRDLRRANGRNDTRTRPAVEEKLSMLDRVWDMYNMLCMQGDMADYDDMVIQAAELVRAGGHILFQRRGRVAVLRLRGGLEGVLDGIGVEDRDHIPLSADHRGSLRTVRLGKPYAAEEKCQGCQGPAVQPGPAASCELGQGHPPGHRQPPGLHRPV